MSASHSPVSESFSLKTMDPIQPEDLAGVEPVAKASTATDTVETPTLRNQASPVSMSVALSEDEIKTREGEGAEKPEKGSKPNPGGVRKVNISGTFGGTSVASAFD